MTWLEECNAAPIASVAQECGLDVLRHSYLSRCPACNETTRSPRDRRPGCARITSTKNAWHCYRCEAGGGNVSLMATTTWGTALSAGDARWGELRSWFASRGWCEAAPEAPPPPKITPRPPPPMEAVTRPDGVEAFWSACLPITASGIGSDNLDAVFLRARGYHRYVYDIAEADLARWATTSAPWWPAGRLQTWRLMVRAYTVDGDFVSVHGRAVVPPPVVGGQSLPKVLWPKAPKDAHYDHTGLFFADRHGLELLRGHPHPELFAVVIAEGLTDWLSLAAWFGQRMQWRERTQQGGPRVAVLGGVSGSFSALKELPLANLDVIATVDNDDAGATYLRQIAEAAPHVRHVRALIGEPRGEA